MSFDPDKMLRKGVVSLEPYVPGRSIEDVQKEYGLDRVIKLASNENVLGPSPLAISDLSISFSDIHRYPDSGSKSLRNSLGIYNKVDSSSIFIGNGGDDVLSVLSRTILNDGDEVILPTPSFAPYEHVSRLMGAIPVLIPLENFEINLVIYNDSLYLLDSECFLLQSCRTLGDDGGRTSEFVILLSIEYISTINVFKSSLNNCLFC